MIRYIHSPSTASYARTRKLQAARLLQLEEQNRQLLQANEEARARHQAVSLRLITVILTLSQTAAAAPRARVKVTVNIDLPYTTSIDRALICPYLP